MPGCLQRHSNMALASYFRAKADPSGRGIWDGRSPRSFTVGSTILPSRHGRRLTFCAWLQHLVYYQLAGKLFADLRSTLGSLRFIEARCYQGHSSAEYMLADYFAATTMVRNVKYAVLKQQLAHLGTVTRASQARWLGEFRTFLGRHMHGLVAHPHMTFQMGMNQVAWLRGPVLARMH